MNGKNKTFELELDKIAHLNETQARAKSSDRETVDRYFTAMDSGERFPPIVVCRNKEDDRWLVVDGHHRVLAAELLGRKTIEAMTIFGDTPCDIRFALAYAAECNWEHGLPRTNADKRKAAEASLVLYAYLADSQIARNLHISDALVASVRADMIATGKLTPKEDKTTKAAKAIADPVNEGKSNREIAKSAGVDEKTVRNIRKKEKSAPDAAPSPDPDQEALDAIANDAKEYIKKREPELSTATEWAADDPEDYDQQERPSIAKITNETRRVVPDVEKPSDPVVVPIPEMADVINVFKKTIKIKGKIDIAIDDDLSDATAKIIAVFGERKGALNVIYAKMQDWLDSRGNT